MTTHLLTRISAGKFQITLLLLVLLIPAESANAWEWGELWTNPDQRAAEAFDKENYEQAARLFEDPAWRAAANYRKGFYEAALIDLEKLDDTDSLFNRANTLAQLYRLQDALVVYRRVLDRDPNHAGALQNIAIVTELLASLADGTLELDLDRLNNENQTQEDEDREKGKEITVKPNGDDVEQNQEDRSESISHQESQDADGNRGNSKLDDPETAEPQEFSAALEQEISIQQWLGRIIDEPGVLLKNKFEQQSEEQFNDRTLLPPDRDRLLW